MLISLSNFEFMSLSDIYHLEKNKRDAKEQLMKSLLLIASSLLILGSAFAEVITVDVPAGHHAVVISHTRHHSGCGSTTNYLSVLRGEDKYIIGSDIGLKNDKPIFRNLMPKLLPPPRMTCMAYVSTTTKARFEHAAFPGQTIDVEIPAFMAEDYKVEVQKVQVVY